MKLILLTMVYGLVVFLTLGTADESNAPLLANFSDDINPGEHIVEDATNNFHTPELGRGWNSKSCVTKTRTRTHSVFKTQTVRDTTVSTLTSTLFKTATTTSVSSICVSSTVCTQPGARAKKLPQHLLRYNMI